jgi:uncharacterized protein YlxW (UPF0749 family)
MMPTDAELSGMDRREIISALKMRDAEPQRLESRVCELCGQVTPLLAEVKDLKAAVEKLERDQRQKRRFANVNEHLKLTHLRASRIDPPWVVFVREG